MHFFICQYFTFYKISCSVELSINKFYKLGPVIIMLNCFLDLKVRFCDWLSCINVLLNSLPTRYFFMLFCCLLNISKSTFMKNSFRDTIRVSNSFDLDQT